MSRFGNNSATSINMEMNRIIPINTRRTRSSIWNQFMKFCKTRKFDLTERTTVESIAELLGDWAFNMRKVDGHEYKAGVIKTMWNSVAKMVQELYYEKFKIVFDPFNDMIFHAARNARNAKRKQLQTNGKQRAIKRILINTETLVTYDDENTPSSLQMKFFQIASTQLAWSAEEASKCLLEYFRIEINNDGSKGRIEYSPTLSITSKGESVRGTDRRWMLPNFENESICPVRLFKALLSKRSSDITTNRLFLYINPNWNKTDRRTWYQNCPMEWQDILKLMPNVAEIKTIEDEKIQTNIYEEKNYSTVTEQRNSLSPQAEEHETRGREDPYEKDENAVDENMTKSDECSAFGEFVAHKLRNLGSSRCRAIAQNRISNALFETEMTYSTDESIHASNKNTPNNPTSSYTNRPTYSGFMPMIYDSNESSLSELEYKVFHNK